MHARAHAGTAYIESIREVARSRGNGLSEHENGDLAT